jgi:predicted phage-related endonuclease
MLHVVKTEQEWHQIRGKYVTASEAAVLVGADPYSSPSKVRNPEPFSGNAYTKVGQMLEPVVVNVVNSILNTSFCLYENQEGHKEFYTEGSLGATPDAHMDRRLLLECKTTRPQTYIKYGAVPPSKYIIQLLAQMECTGIEEGYLAIMSTNLTQNSPELFWPISIYKVWKNKYICDILKSEAERFLTNKTFRVDSRVKSTVKLLIPTIYEQVV